MGLPCTSHFKKHAPELSPQNSRRARQKFVKIFLGVELFNSRGRGPGSEVNLHPAFRDDDHTAVNKTFFASLHAATPKLDPLSIFRISQTSNFSLAYNFDNFLQDNRDRKIIHKRNCFSKKS